MAVSVYNVPSERIVHKAAVDFKDRSHIAASVHLMQYDKSLPVIKLSCFLAENLISFQPMLT